MGTFILSLDCEGKWGSADHLSSPRIKYFTDRRLLQTYGTLCQILTKYNLPATFAFTGGFALSHQMWGELHSEIDYLETFLPRWLGFVKHDIAINGADGWFGNDCLSLVQKSKLHEIGAHGFTHAPWGSPDMSLEAARLELDLCSRVFGNSLETFIYPRNSVAHEVCLSEKGIVGFQISRKDRRVSRLLREFNIYEKSEEHALAESLIRIPAGFFLNWQNGLRRIVPISLTQLRWRQIINDAIETDGVAHLWTYPENFLQAPEMFELLDGILNYVNSKSLQGDLNVLTQAAYCKQILRSSKDPRLHV